MKVEELSAKFDIPPDMSASQRLSMHLSEFLVREGADIGGGISVDATGVQQ